MALAPPASGSPKTRTQVLLKSRLTPSEGGRPVRLFTVNVRPVTPLRLWTLLNRRYCGDVMDGTSVQVR